MLVYVVLLTALFLGHVLDLFFAPLKKHPHLRNGLFVWAPIVILILLSTLKADSVGTDTITYHNLYQEAAILPSVFTNTFHGFGRLFSFFFISFAKAGVPFRAFQFFLYSSIYIPFGFLLQKETKSPLLSLFIFSTWSWLLFNFSGIRQGLSDMLCVLALFVFIRAVEKKKIIGIVGGVLILFGAFFIHKSAIIFGAAFPVVLVCKYWERQSAKLMTILCFVIPGVFFLAPELYQFFFYLLGINYYIPTNRSGVGKLFLLYYLFFVVALSFSKGKFPSRFANKLVDRFDRFFPARNSQIGGEDNRESTLGIDVCTGVFAIGAIIQSFSSVCFSMTRLGNPFLLIATFLIPNIIDGQRSKSLRLLAGLGVCATMLAVFYVDYYATNQLDGFPYMFGF